MFTTKRYDDYKQAVDEIISYLGREYRCETGCEFTMHSYADDIEEDFDSYECFTLDDDPDYTIRRHLPTILKRMSKFTGVVYWSRSVLDGKIVSEFTFHRTLSDEEQELLEFEYEFFISPKENDGFDCHVAVGDKIQYLRNHCPVELDYSVERRKCLVCNSVFRLADCKVIPCTPEDQIVCAKHPLCRGTIYDWVMTDEPIVDGDRLSETRKEYDADVALEKSWMEEEEFVDDDEDESAGSEVTNSPAHTEKDHPYDIEFDIDGGGLVIVYKDDAEVGECAIVVVNGSFYDHVSGQCDMIKDNDAMQNYLFTHALVIDPVLAIEVSETPDSDDDEDEE